MLLAKTINRLTARQVETIEKPGLHADGGGLYLSTKKGGRNWTFVFQWGGKRKEMGLGSARNVSLARAREMAAEASKTVADGINPIEARDASRALRAHSAKPVSALTFGEFADAYITSVEDGWRNQIHRRQWRNSLRDHAAAIKDKPISDISTDDVLSVLNPIWMTFPETAGRVRGRIEKVLAAAKALGHRSVDSANPAQWRGHLEVLLPKQPQLVRGHHAAMAYSELPAFMKNLADRPAMAARALEFLIFNAARSGEVLNAKWGEIDGDLWTIPASRMKAGVAHTVTLSPAATAILDELSRGNGNAYIFPGRKAGRPLSGMSMSVLLGRMDRGDVTVHGFRSAFKDWSVDCTDFADELSEEALAHVVGSKVRRAYRRGEALSRRRRLMEAWAGFLTTAPFGTVIQDEAA